MIVTLTSQNLQQCLRSHVLVIKFAASWCGPCKMFAPVFEQVATHYQGDPNIVFATCDIDGQSAVAAQFQVRSVPTIAIVKDGNLVHHQSGGPSAQALAGLVSQASQS